MAERAISISGKYRYGGVLIAFFIFAAQVVFEGAALAGAEQAQVAPASLTGVRAQSRRLRGRHDRKIDILDNVLSDAIVTVDPKCTHGAWGRLPLTVHQVIDHKRVRDIKVVYCGVSFFEA